MSDREPTSNLSRRQFLSFSNKAGIALISAGTLLSVIPPTKLHAASRNGEDALSNAIKPVRNGSTAALQRKMNRKTVSTTITLNGQKYLLNPEGSFLWNLCNGRHGMGMMSQALSLRYRKSRSAVADDVRHFIDILRSLNLVQASN
jgi:hypothetical protein